MKTTSSLVFGCAIANGVRIGKILAVSVCVTSFSIAPAHADPAYDIVWLDDFWVGKVSRNLSGAANATVGIVGDSVIGPVSSVPFLTASTEAGPLSGKANQTATLSRRFTIVRQDESTANVHLSGAFSGFLDLDAEGSAALTPQVTVVGIGANSSDPDSPTSLSYSQHWSINTENDHLDAMTEIFAEDELSINKFHRLVASLYVKGDSNNIFDSGKNIATGTLDLRDPIVFDASGASQHKVLWLGDWDVTPSGVSGGLDGSLKLKRGLLSLALVHGLSIPSWIVDLGLDGILGRGEEVERYDFQDGLTFAYASGQADLFIDGNAEFTVKSDRDFMIVSAKSEFVSLSFDGLLEGSLKTDANTSSALKLAQVKIDGANIEWKKNAEAKNGDDVTIFEPFGLEATVFTNKIFTYEATLELSSGVSFLALGSTSAEFLSSLGGELSVAAADAFFTAEKPLATDPNPNGGNFLNSEIGAGHQKIADEFTIDLAGFVQMVQWYGAFAPIDLSTTLFEIQFYKDADGAPAMDPYFSHVFDIGVGAPTGITLSSIDVLMYEADFSGLQAYLPQGQSWISIRAADPSSQFFWSISDPALGDPIYHRFNDDSAWSMPVGDGRTEAAFAVFVQAPEPGLLALAGSGLAFLALLAVRRRAGVIRSITPSAAP